MSKRIEASDAKFLRQLAKEYPTVAAASSGIINSQAKLKLPKPTEHFMSDLHGEHEAFAHILSNASGVVKEKVDRVLGQELNAQERAEFATLIYYPQQKLAQIKAEHTDLLPWYRITLSRLIEVCRMTSSKHTRSFVRAHLPKEFAHILDELLHAHFEDHDKELYYDRILSSILDVGRGDDFIIALAQLIQHLAVYKLHIVGDLFDRGARPDLILDQLMAHHSVDIQWGNHDVQWMGAAAGSPICIASVIRVTLSYNNLETLEDGYGINLRPLSLFAEEVYEHSNISAFLPKVLENGIYSSQDLERVARMNKAIAIILFKLECAVVARNPDFGMREHALLQYVDFTKQMVNVDGVQYRMRDCDFPTVDPKNPAVLTPQEEQVMRRLCLSFLQSERLTRQIRFLYAKGSLYKIENGNLLFHGAIPLREDGSLEQVVFDGKCYQGRAWMDHCEVLARQGYFAPEGSVAREKGQDFLWYLWCGRFSPIFGRHKMSTFESLFIDDDFVRAERKNPYYSFIENADEQVAEQVAKQLLAEFGLNPETGHIINGHVPVRANQGETPIKAKGRVLIIDGGFCKAYHKRTGIAGYTLVSSSRGLSLRSHGPFESTQKAIRNNIDILSTVNVVERKEKRLYLEDCDEGERLKELIADLRMLLDAYAQGIMKES